MIKIMNAILKFTLASIVILMSSISASAQDYNEEKLFQQRAKKRVKLMNDYVSFMQTSQSLKKLVTTIAKKPCHYLLARATNMRRMELLSKV